MIMNRSSDILFMAEYIKNVLYFATVRTGKTIKCTSDIHYFSIDSELVYENYFSDFGPLNLGCVYKYCTILNDKLKQYLNKQTIVHYTTIDPKKKANAAFLLGCYGVLYLSLSPRDALKPLLVHGQSYRPFQDATQGDSAYTISLMDCLQAIKTARDLGLFNFQDFNYEEYDRLDKIQGGDLNWIIPGKFLAFIGPVDYSVSLYHPPKMYINYFLENNVQIVIRLNKRLYDGNVFNNAGIVHYDLFFPDGSCPPRNILQKFLQISEESNGAIAVHCKAGLGRTGSLIGCYLMKHYRMTSHEAIGWMRICRPGSVIGHQQGWLEELEAWLTKQGNLYRKRTFSNTEKLPVHEFGIYSIMEKTKKQKQMVYHKSQSPPPPPLGPRVTRPDVSVVRPQSSKIREDKSESEDEEVFLTSCDLTDKPAVSMTQIKGCIIRNNTINEENDVESVNEPKYISYWKKLLCCEPCTKTLQDAVWAFSVRCARVAPGTCYFNRFCRLFDMFFSFFSAAINKTKKEQYDWRVRSYKLSSHGIPYKGQQYDTDSTDSRRGSGSGEPRLRRSLSRSSADVTPVQINSCKTKESVTRTTAGFHPTITTFRSSNGPVIRNVNDAKKFLIRSSLHNEERERQLKSSIRVTPHHYTNQVPNYLSTTPGNIAHITPSISTAVRATQPQHRRRLGRSPSPPQVRKSNEQTRATNTPTPIQTTTQKFLAKNASKSTLIDALSRLKLTSPRDGSVGATSVGVSSLGARRDAPLPKQAPSVRSDERPLATQGDMLNSIKFQRRYIALHSDKLANPFNNTNKTSVKSKEKASSKNICPKPCFGVRSSMNQGFMLSREKPSSTARNFGSPARPSSPKGRRSPHSPGFY